MPAKIFIINRVSIDLLYNNFAKLNEYIEAKINIAKNIPRST
jgi:hypothetical protein